MPLVNQDINTCDEFKNILNNAVILNQIIILKFGANWCKPCELIHSQVSNCIQHMDHNILFYNIDIDENLDLYVKLKSKKMISGIPALLAWFPVNRIIDNEWFIMSESVSGTNNNDINIFFEKCNNYYKK
jgi:thiol-disulfide isomerase/thioredoxin